METEPEQLQLFDPELEGIVQALDIVIQEQEYCPFVVQAITRYISPINNRSLSR